MRRAAAALRPGWLLLAGDALRRDAAWARSVKAALIHADVGVALLGAEPAAVAAAKFRQALDAVGFLGVFGSYPPIVYRMVPPLGLPLWEILDAAFALEPKLALSGGAAWVKAVRDVLAAGGADPAETPIPREEASAAQPVVPIPASAEGGEARRPRRKLSPLVVSGLALACSAAWRWRSTPQGCRRRRGSRAARIRRPCRAAAAPCPSGRPPQASVPGPGRAPVPPK